MTTIERMSLSIHETAVRTTPPPAGQVFRDVLVQGSRAVLRTAVSAAAYLPGGSLVTAAVRGALVPTLGGGTLSSVRSGPSPLGSTPDGVGTGGATGSAASPVGGATGTPQGALPGGDDDMLSRGHEMSMQMLRLQEAIGEENRRYTALSNVLHARHEMAKNAIGNIR